jgi:hypothetical protein
MASLPEGAEGVATSSFKSELRVVAYVEVVGDYMRRRSRCGDIQQC